MWTIDQLAIRKNALSNSHKTESMLRRMSKIVKFGLWIAKSICTSITKASVDTDSNIIKCSFVNLNCKTVFNKSFGFKKKGLLKQRLQFGSYLFRLLILSAVDDKCYGLNKLKVNNLTVAVFFLFNYLGQLTFRIINITTHVDKIKVNFWSKSVYLKQLI